MKYRKKPVTIEAIQWTGSNVDEMKDFVNDAGIISFCTGELLIKTLEGTMLAREGDYIIQGVNGEFYPCKPDIFEKTYEKED